MPNLGKYFFKKLIWSVLDKTHVPDFPDSSSFAQNLNRKTVTSYSSKFLSWNISWWFGNQIYNLKNILEAKMVSDIKKYIKKPSLIKLCIIIINLHHFPFNLHIVRYNAFLCVRPAVGLWIRPLFNTYFIHFYSSLSYHLL